MESFFTLPVISCMVNDAFVEIWQFTLAHHLSYLPSFQLAQQTEILTYTLRNPPPLTPPRQCPLSLRMRQPRHCSRANEKRQFHLLPQHLRARIHMPDVPQQSWSKPYPIKHALVRISRYQIRGSAGVKGPCFLAEHFFGDGFEVVAVY